VAKIWKVPDQKTSWRGRSPDYPYVITTYRLTEHHLSGSCPLPAVLAEMFESNFAEISHELAGELGSRTERRSRSRRLAASPREGHGHESVQAFSSTARRSTRSACLALGYNGISKGDITRPVATVGDPNVYIQETKAFVCNVKKGVV